MPLAARGLAAAGLLIFILCWNEYLFSVYLADNHAMTMPPYLAAQCRCASSRQVPMPRNGLAYQRRLSSWRPR